MSRPQPATWGQPPSRRRPIEDRLAEAEKQLQRERERTTILQKRAALLEEQLRRSYRWQANTPPRE